MHLRCVCVCSCLLLVRVHLTLQVLQLHAPRTSKFWRPGVSCNDCSPGLLCMSRMHACLKMSSTVSQFSIIVQQPAWVRAQDTTCIAEASVRVPGPLCWHVVGVAYHRYHQPLRSACAAACHNSLCHHDTHHHTSSTSFPACCWRQHVCMDAPA
jgi:hypothetical protein